MERRWAQSVLGGFAPHGTAADGGDDLLSPREGEVDFGRTMELMMRASSPMAALGMRLALWMVVFWPLPRTFPLLPVEQRTQLLRRLLAHRLFAVRELVLLLKLCASMALFSVLAIRDRSNFERRDHYDEVVEHSGERPRIRLPLAEGDVPMGQEVA